MPFEVGVSEPPVPLAEITQRIVEAFHPRRIVLFGSYARGDAHRDSDIDLMIEMETAARPIDRVRAVHNLFRTRTWAMDVFVYTPEELRALRGVTGTIASIIDAEGRVIYERAA